jgi:hypothetical protein
MARRGTLRPHGDDEEDEDGPTEEKRVFNRGENGANMMTNGKNRC